MSLFHNIMKFSRCATFVHISRSLNLKTIDLKYKIQVLGSCCSTRQASSVPTLQSIKEKKVSVYTGPLTKKIKFVKVLSLTSSAVGLSVLPFLVYDIGKVSSTMAALTGIMSSFFLLTPIMLNFITKRYVIELIFNRETKIFTAKRYDLFNRIQEIKFTADDVIAPDVPGILTSIVIKNSPLFVDSTMVKDNAAYIHMMGYDKPIELNLSCAKDETKKS